MYQWKKFFAALATLGGIIIPAAFTLYFAAKNEAFNEHSKILVSIMPEWEQPVLAAAKAAADFISPYVLPAAIVFLFCLAIGPRTFSQRARILWSAFWIFFVFSVAVFLTQAADPFKMPFWPALINLASGAIETAKTIFGFNIYIGWAAGIAFIYSLIIYFKDLAAAFLNLGAGFLDRRIKPMLIDELKTSLGVRLIYAPANLIPITPSLSGLIIVIFAIGGLPLFLAPRLQDFSLTSTMNILGAAILTYGFIQVFGVILIFLTGLIYYILKKKGDLNHSRFAANKEGAPDVPFLPRKLK